MAEERRLIALAFVCATLAAACGGSDEVDGPQTRADAVVRDALGSDREWMRAETVRLIGVAAPDEYRAELMAALDDMSPVVQTAAIEALLREGARAVEDQALSRLVSGSDEQRLQLLDLVVDVGRTDFRTEMIMRGLRDVSPRVRVAAMRHAVATNTALGQSDLQRLLVADEPEVADEAFLTFATFDRAGALDAVLRSLRSSDDEERARGLRFARHIASASLWPMMRSYAAQEGDPVTQRLALLVLGYLGDPVAELGLRDILLSADDATAAEALAAISHIPTPRAQDQPLVHRRDARAAVRRSALDALIRQDRPTDDFELFLEDSDPAIAEAALVHMQRSDPERAAALFQRALADTDDPRPALTALYRVSLHHDIRRFLDASAAQLTRYLAHPDMKVSGLAARLLVAAFSPVEMQNRIRRSETPDALYALIEATYGTDGNFSDLYTAELDNDLAMIRIAAALGIVSLGEAYTPPAVAPDS